MMEHLHFYPYLLDVLAIHKIKVIQLTRENILAQAISTIQLHENKVAHTTSGKTSPRVKVPLSLLQKHLSSIERIQQQKEMLADKQVLTLKYEDMFNPSFPLENKLKEFLGCDSLVRNAVQLKKIGGKTLGQQVINDEEVLSYLKNSKYANLIY